MSAFQSRGAGVLVKLRAEHRLSLNELALVLFASYEDMDAEEHFTVQDTRQAIASVLVAQGAGAVSDASDAIRGASEQVEGSLVGREADERLAWARRLVAKAYRRDFAKFPEVLAAFERGESA